MNFKKLSSLLTVGALSLGLVACGQETATDDVNAISETMTVTHFQGETEVPVNPEVIVVLDYAALDIIDALGLGDRVAGTPKDSILSYLSAYENSEEVVHLGGLKEVDMEALYSIQPDLIISGGRQGDFYADLSDIAPTVQIGLDRETPYLDAVSQNVEMLASIFKEEAQAETIMSEFYSRIETVSNFANGQSAIVGLVTEGSISILGAADRANLIGGAAGFNNLFDGTTSEHGEQVSFEYLITQNPQYMFIMDRDSAIGAEGSQTAKEVIENELVMELDVYKNGNIIYLNSEPWYLAEGGITATNLMISDIEQVLK